MRTVIYKDGEYIVENTGVFYWISFLYTTFVGRFLCRLLRLHVISKLYAVFQCSRLSRYKINRFIKAHHINMHEAVIPQGGFTSFNDFFIRKLGPGARSIDAHEQSLVSVADSKLLVVPSIEDGYRFFVKSKPFYLKTFLQDEFLAEKYQGGTLMIFRLAPYDYHRYHFLCEGTPQAPIIIPGSLDSVNPVVYKAGFLPLATNERHLIRFQTKHFGMICIIPVGAMFVGTIAHTYLPDKEYKKGDEMGYFSFGGSTLVVLIERGLVEINPLIVAHSQQNIETVVKMGEKIT